MAYADGETIDKKRQAALAPLERCGLAAAADMIGDRWMLLILREALYGVTRFDAIQAELGIPRTVLSGRLKKLCAAGILTARRYQEPGQRSRHQYVLTPKGVDLALPMIALMQWGDKHCLDGAAADVVERRTGAPCRVGLISAAGTPVEIGDVKLQLNVRTKAAA